jgi:transposase
VELREWLASELGVTVSLGCLWRTLDRLGLRLKKSRFVPPSRSGRMCRRPARLGVTADRRSVY